MKWPHLAFRSVRQKLLAGALLTSLVALLVSGAGLFAYDLHRYRQASQESLAIEARLLAHATSAALQFDDRQVATTSLSFFRERPAIRAAALYNPRGALFATYLRGGVPKSELPLLPSADSSKVAGDRVEVFHRIVVDNEIVGSVYLSEDLGTAQRVASYAAIALAVLVAALAVSATVSVLVQRGITQPILQVSELAHEVVTKRNYAVRATRTTQDEIGTLVDAFNEMLAEIQARTAALESSSEEVGRLNKDLERRVAERTSQLEESNLQLQSANLAKSNFLSMMSHEIRTPMNGVLGMLELLSLSTLDPQQRTTLEIVRGSGRSLLRIIDDILDFSKIEAGKLEVRPEVASISRLIATVTGIYSGNASSKALVLKASVDPRISPAVMVDPLRLQQVLNNLVSNAIKFTTRGSVEIKAVLLERRDGVDMVEISVTDTGVGISPEGQKALFQPFAQGGSEVTRVFGGTGLGLSIGRRLTTLMGGEVSIASRLGHGTTATIRLPLPIADPAYLPEDVCAERDELGKMVSARRDPPGAAQAEAEGTLVLVVDDHPINRMLLMRQVGLLGYAVESAENGRDALQLWESRRFSLVITDCNMPEMDGYELARAIRSREASTHGPRTCIIACTANALAGEAENCFAAGMDDYVAKPVELPRMMAMLDRWLPLPGEMEVPPLDRNVLAVIAGGDTALEQEVLSQFITLNAQDVAMVEQAIESRDAAMVTGSAHRVKGSANAIGATALAQAGAKLEAAARAGDWDAIIEHRPKLKHEARRLTELLVGITANN